MKYALINGEKREPEKGLKGNCPNCAAELIAKCGDQRIHHWAHKGKRHCDPWWENETEWHRAWKSNYSEDWQEIPMPDIVNKETHIADVRTENGLVLEFQHSHIHPDERTARERFYKKMVWIVDGTRHKRDYPRYVSGIPHLFSGDGPGFYQVNWAYMSFPKEWIGRTVPVVFDFKGMDNIDNPSDERHLLYCLSPVKKDDKYILATLTREEFVKLTTTGDFLTLFIEKPKPPQQTQSNSSGIGFPMRSSSFIFHKGRFVRRRRF